MFYILSYRDMARGDGDGEGYRNITNTLGDIYYHAGLYDQAEDIYSELLLQYEQEGVWDHYRPYVLMNNLGQIALKEHNYPLAAQWFTRSLEMARLHLTVSYKNNTMAYTMLKLAQTALDAGEVQKAEQWLLLVDSIPKRLIHTDVQAECQFLRGRLFLFRNQPESALQVLTGGLSLDSLQNKGGRFIPDVYRLVSQVYQQLGNYPMALAASQHYVQLTDSMKAREHLVRSMVILADRNHQQSQEELKETKWQVQLLWIIVFVVLSVLIIVSVFARKLYKAKLELVRKALKYQEDTSTRKDLSVRKTEPITDESDEDNDLQSPEELISRLTEVMVAKKLYLNTGLSILDVARELSTNRTYLSKAINNHLKTNFPGFVNDYRIKEAISLILSGYATDHTIEALASSSGFANRNVFSAAFKKNTGVVPSFFIANYHRWDHQTASFVDEE
jgi:AraC-like DNA-binding protein